MLSEMRDESSSFSVFLYMENSLSLVASLHSMKTFRIILLLALLASTNGCMTYSTIKRAKGEQNPVMGSPAKEPQPGYYALVPLTVPADIVTSPFQLLFYAIAKADGGF